MPCDHEDRDRHGEPSAGPSPVELARTAPVYDIFDRSAEYLGELDLPERFVPLEIGSDNVLGAVMDENDVPFVRMYALRRGT